MAGREINQKRKKHRKSRVVVPEDEGRWFAEKSVVYETVLYKAWSMF